MKILFNFLIFPGLIFSIVAGLIIYWIDRKLTARIQMRVGPPWYQNFVDIVKLLGKETIIPEGAHLTFLLAPFLGFLSLVLVATILGRSVMSSQEGFIADLIVVLYLLIIPAVALIIGASSSRNPLASVGASREMKLVLAYELPFILAIIAVIIKSAGRIQIGSIISYQSSHGSNAVCLSGILAFLAALLCVQAKLGVAPFDCSEAEEEIMAGVLIEYSGLPLAIFRLTKCLLMYVMPLFLIILFWAKDLTPIFLVLKFLGILTAVILIKNTNPRVRIDQAMRFFWGPVTLLALAAVILAIFGL